MRKKFYWLFSQSNMKNDKSSKMLEKSKNIVMFLYYFLKFIKELA